MSGSATTDLALLGKSVGLWSREDAHGDVESWSPRFYELLGYRPGEIASTLGSFRDLLHPDDVDRTFDLVDHHFAGNAEFDIDYRVRASTGEYRWFRGLAAVSRDADGAPRHMAGSIIDIDAQILAERRLEALSDDLSDLVEIAARDFGGPARRQHLLTELIIDDHDDQLSHDLERLLVHTRAHARRGLALVEAFQVIAQSRDVSTEAERFEPIALIDSLLAELLPTIGRGEPMIDVPDSVHTNWAATRLLFSSLISNAAQHGPTNLGLNIYGINSGDVQHYVVENSLRPSAPRPWGTVSSPTPRQLESDWFGLGLRICKRAALVLGGDLRVCVSQETFRVEFTIPNGTR